MTFFERRLKDDGRICRPGGKKGTVFAPNPLGDLDNRAKVMIYGFFLLYSFIGVSIVADQFMAAIERITSKKRRVKVSGTANRYITVNVWNETVANLTLMALGSSAPEILLAINEIFKNQFHSGELGPSTIVGSAAFNLFVIIAVCINAIPSGETREIKETGVFFITGFFSVFAYLWMLVIVQIESKDIVTVTEGALTFLFFPVLVWISYAEDAGLLRRWFCSRSERRRQKEEEEAAAKAQEEADRIALANGTLTPQQLARRNAAKAGGNNMGAYAMRNRFEDDPTEDVETEEKESKSHSCTQCVNWFCGKLRKLCMGCCNIFCGLFKPCKKCCRRFRKLRKRKKADDAEGEDNADSEEELVEEEDIDMSDPATKILDEEGEPIESETGIITFQADSMEVAGDSEEQQYSIPVYRKNGLDGRISCKYRMERFTATPGYDYVEDEGIVDFKNGVHKAEIQITILPKQIGEKSDMFQLVLEEPTNEAIMNPTSDGGEESCLLTIQILNMNTGSNRTARFYGIIDSLINIDEMKQGAAAWWEQLEEAWYVNGSAEEQEEAKFLDWVSYVIVFPWGMLYAIATPPPPFLEGWVCFVVALIHIGALTAVIGDIAELFGCAANIPDNITAITVVALGTSLPDLFASKAAATQDEWADASIVNVTGSNSVNVFLGIGLPWLMAALYWHIVDGSKDTLWMEKYEAEFIDRCPQGCFVVPSGDLTFSVVVFTCGALICLAVIRLRRVMYGGELGGPIGSDSKACSSFFMVMLWVFYIGLSIWKSSSGVEDWGVLIMAIVICVPVIIALLIFFGLMLQLLRLSKDYIGEEGFVGIAVASAIVILRGVYFLMFQMSDS